MRSIIACLHGSDFPRLKIGVAPLGRCVLLQDETVPMQARAGIGQPRAKGGDKVIDHVLTDFSKDEWQAIDTALQESIGIIKAVLKLGIDKAVSGARAP